jgi:ATP-dependent RNA helicase SUPV3L1/SUV3
MRPVTALLGPTNTGKTYLALERMLAHRSGMIGFPLRLLARENYDRVAAAKGREAVALVTGEERIVPRHPRYFVCTVEAMPVDRRVDFLAVDEVQLAADRERGHVFTDRLLNARGQLETMLIGAETMRPLLRRLLPEAAFLSRPRLSTLRYSPPKKLARLPRRSAVIVFSVRELYKVAERLRRDRGGSALVFGALSPRTRNAQVALYQAGDVDHLVATDAIGMGLNLDIDHVVFTSLHKFDGVAPRELTAAEVGQIAGRAGRHVQDGSFSPTAELGPFEEGLVQAIEGHRFAPLTSVYWRNAELDFSSSGRLLESLERRPPRPELVRMRQAEDHRALAALVTDPEVEARARGADAMALLWEVCQVPDFGMSETHTRLLARVFHHLSGPGRRLPEDWIATQVRDLDRTEGDVDTLLARIAAIRTWTYVSHRPSWLSDAEHWQERTRAVEDRLSDALHERLTQQFVDRPSAVIARYDPSELVTVVTEGGEVLVQGLRAGVLEGFRFVPDRAVREGSKGLLAAANRALRGGIRDRVAALGQDADAAFALRTSGQIDWRGAEVGRLLPGDSVLAPQVEVLPSELLDAPLREPVRRRLASWLDAHLRAHLGPLLAARDATLSGAARGLVFVLAESLGTVPRRQVAAHLAALSPDDRRALNGLGVTLGRLTVFMPALLRPEALRLRTRLFAIRHGGPAVAAADGVPSVPLHPGLSSAFYAACGYQAAGPRAVRVDRLDRVAAAASRLSREGPFAVPAELAPMLGCPPREVPAVLAALGYVERDGRFAWRRNGERRRA